jgi:thioredoxin-dependent peroxiredoxin
VQGQGLRDSARTLEALDCVVLGASFDTVASNHAFATAQEFPFRLLSDVDRLVGERYQVVRASGHQYADYPERISYLIDPDGVIRRSYAVHDVAGHAATVIADLTELQRDSD